MNRKMRRARLLGQTAMIALMPAMVMAQETPVIPLEQITVTGDGTGDGTGPVAGVANPSTQAGAKTGTPVTDIPQSVSVIGSESLKALNLAKIDEALAYTAGVIGAPYGYDSDTNWHFIRGFASTATGVFQDGLAHYSYGFGGFFIDPVLVERVEVLKGPASVLYGGANPGGVLNYVSKTPTGEPGGDYEIGVDENGRAWVGTDVNGLTKDGLAWRFTGKLERVDGYGAFEPGIHGVIAPSLSFNLDSGTEITLLASYTHVNEDHVGGSWLPYTGTVVAAPFGYIDRDFNSGEPALDWYEREQLLLTSLVKHDLGNGWALNNTTRFGWSDIDESAPYAFGYAGYSATPTDADNTLARIFFQHQTETQTLLNDTRLEKTFATGGAEHRVLAGIDLKYFKMDQVQASIAWPNAATGLSATNPVYGAPQLGTTPYIDQVITQKQAGLYLQDQIRWGDGWIATVNGRYDVVSLDATGTPAYSTTDHETSWRAGLARNLPNGLTPYISAASFFNPQIGTSSVGMLTPETGEQYELGLKWAPEGRNALFTFAAFDLSRQGVITGPFNAQTQLGEVRSRGIELEGKGEIAPGLTLEAALTAMDVEVTQDADTSIIGKTPYATIEKFASLKLSYDVAAVPGLTVTGGVRHLGSSWADAANTLEVPAVTLLDAGVRFENPNGWGMNFAVTNLTDETYVASCQTALSCFYGDGRKASLVLRRSF